MIDSDRPPIICQFLDQRDHGWLTDGFGGEAFGRASRPSWRIHPCNLKASKHLLVLVVGLSRMSKAQDKCNLVKRLNLFHFVLYQFMF